MRVAVTWQKQQKGYPDHGYPFLMFLLKALPLVDVRETLLPEGRLNVLCLIVSLRGMLHLFDKLRDLLVLLHGLLMALQSGLDHLSCLTFALSNFLQAGCILLFLLQQLLVHG